MAEKKGLDQKDLEVLVDRAVNQKNESAIRELKKLLLAGEVHQDAASGKFLVGPPPAAPVAAPAPVKAAGAAAKKDLTEEQLKEMAASEDRARQAAAAQKAEEQAALAKLQAEREAAAKAKAEAPAAPATKALTREQLANLKPGDRFDFTSKNSGEEYSATVRKIAEVDGKTQITVETTRSGVKLIKTQPVDRWMRDNPTMPSGSSEAEAPVAPVVEAPKGEKAKKGTGTAAAPAAPAVPDPGFVRAPDAPAASAPAGPKLLGSEGAAQFRKAAADLGVDGDRILKLKGVKAKQLDQIPDTEENRKVMREWLAGEANKPGARARVRMNNAPKTEGPASPLKLGASESEKAGRRGGRAPVGGISTPLSIDEVKRRNFARLDERYVLKRANEFLGDKVELTDIDRRKVGELLLLRDEVKRIPDLKLNAEAQMLLEKLDDRVSKLTDAVKGAGDPTPFAQSFANSHDEFFYKGRARGSLLATSDKNMPLPWSEQRRKELGPTLGEKYAKDPRGFELRKNQSVRAIREVSGFKNNRELKQLLVENGLISVDTPATNQRGLIAAIPESKVPDLKAYVSKRQEEIAAEAAAAKKATSTGAPAPAAAERPGAATAAGGAAEIATSGIGGGEKPALAGTAPAAPEAAAPAASTAEKLSKKEASKLRSSLGRISPEAEEGLLKAARAKGLSVSKLEDLPKSELSWANKWTSGSQRSMSRPPKALQVSKRRGYPRPAGPFGNAVPEGRVMGPAESLAGRVMGPTLDTGEIRQAVPRGIFPQFPDEAQVAANRAAIAAEGAAGAAEGAASKVGRLGRLGAGALRFLGPLAAVYGAYEIASALKGQTIDEADERRLRVMQALGAVGGGMGQSMMQKEQIRAMQRMTDLAAVQRQAQIDEINKQYTGNMAMDSLIRGNEAALAALATPSRPGVAELMMRY